MLSCHVASLVTASLSNVATAAVFVQVRPQGAALSSIFGLPPKCCSTTLPSANARVAAPCFGRGLQYCRVQGAGFRVPGAGGKGAGCTRACYSYV